MVAISTAIAIAGLAVAGTAAYMQYQGQQKQAGYEQQRIAEQQRQDDLRKQSQDLAAARQRRQVIREGVLARSQALATATAQGAGYGSSAAGAVGNESGQTGVNLLGINQNQELGTSMYESKLRESSAQRGYSEAGSNVAMWAGIGSFGNAMIKSQSTIDRVGTYAFGDGKIGYFDNGGGSAPIWR